MEKIAVFGSSNMDLVVNVEHMPRKGETVRSLAFATIPGGKGANQACACGRLGGDCVFLSAVGSDANGRSLLESLSAAGVDTRHMLVSEDAPTGMALITVDAGGENSIVVVPGANALCGGEYYESARGALADAGVILAQLETPEGTVFRLLWDMHAEGKITILNPAPAPECLPDWLYASLDYITPNETELAAMTGLAVDTAEDAAAAARVLLDRGARNVVVTLGKLGAMLVNGAGAMLFPAFETAAVDTTAAGDTFNAALAVGLAEGLGPEGAITLGNAAASISVSRPGAQTSIPTREEADALVAAAKIRTNS